MSTISLVHPSLNRAGGAERYLLVLTSALQRRGYSVSLYTIDRTEWEKLLEIQGIETRPDKEYFLQEKPLEPTGLISWIRATIRYVWLLIWAREETELCINNYGETLPVISDISIVHAVPLIAKNGNPYNIPLWEYTRHIYEYIHRRLAAKTSEIIITNSRYNMEKIRPHYESRTYVVNPPVATSTYYGGQKNGRILTIARISPNKDLQRVTNIANITHRNRFIIAGKTDQHSERVLKVLREMRNIDLHINPPRLRLMELMQRSSILLSTQMDEAFGMAIVEAMSVGCIPLVYRGGGPWTDILEEKEGDIGYAYESEEEAAEKIKLLLGDSKHRNQLRERCVERSKEYNPELFEEKIIRIIEDAMPVRPEDFYTRLYRARMRLKAIRAPWSRG